MKDNKTQIQLETTNESFFRVFDWMYQRLGLTGNELLVFAVIYDCDKRFQQANPSLDQISARIGIARRTLQVILNTFEKRKLIVVERAPGRTSTYSVNEAFTKPLTRAEIAPVQNLHPCENCTGTRAESAPHPCRNCTTPVQNLHPLKERKEREESLRNKAGAPAREGADSKNLSQTSTDYDTECLNIFWKLYPETRKKTIDSIRDDFLAIPSTEYPLLLSVLHHKLFDSELGDEWRRQDGRFIPGIKRYLSDQYWKREDNRCLEMFEYTPEGIEMNKSTPEDLQSQLSQNLKELRIL